MAELYFTHTHTYAMRSHSAFMPINLDNFSVHQTLSVSNAERFRLPATAAEVAELKHYPNFFKLVQRTITLPGRVPLLVNDRSQR